MESASYTLFAAATFAAALLYLLLHYCIFPVLSVIGSQSYSTLLSPYQQSVWCETLMSMTFVLLILLFCVVHMWKYGVMAPMAQAINPLTTLHFLQLIVGSGFFVADIVILLDHLVRFPVDVKAMGHTPKVFIFHHSLALTIGALCLVKQGIAFGNFNGRVFIVEISTLFLNIRTLLYFSERLLGSLKLAVDACFALTYIFIRMHVYIPLVIASTIYYGYPLIIKQQLGRGLQLYCLLFLSCHLTTCGLQLFWSRSIVRRVILCFNGGSSKSLYRSYWVLYAIVMPPTTLVMYSLMESSGYHIDNILVAHSS